MKEIHLDPKQVPTALRGSYTGRKFSVIVTESVTLHDTTWSGGTRSAWHALDLATGHFSPNVTASSTPPGFRGTCADGQEVPVREGTSIVEHTIFCGKDMGLRFYVHPKNASLLLPDNSGDPLTEAELCLLEATASLKGSYGGRKPRIDMMHSNGFDDAAIEEARASLIEKKFLRANGSITPAGRNHRPERDRFLGW